MTLTEKKAWLNYKNVIEQFLGDVKSPECIDCVWCQLRNFLLPKIRLEDSAYTRLNSSVRRKTCKCAEVTKNSICANAHNSGNYGTRLKYLQD